MLALKAGKSNGTFASGDKSIGFSTIARLFLLHQKIDVGGDVIFILGKDEWCLIGFVVLVEYFYLYFCLGTLTILNIFIYLQNNFISTKITLGTIPNALAKSLQYCSVLIWVGMSGQASK